MGWREPGVRRGEARERTAGLGLAREGARAETARVMGETPGERAVREANAGGPREGGVAIGREAQLMKLLNELLVPLEKKVRETDGPFLFGDTPSYADCVAVGYLSLILMPELPNAWAREGLMARERLAAYVHDMRARMLQGVEVGEVEKADLPWLGGVVLDGFWETVKGWKSGTGEEEWRDDDPLVEERKKKAFLQRRREWWKSVGFVTAGLLGMGAYVVWSGIVAFGGAGGQEEEHEEEEHEEQEPEQVDMGDEDDEE
jgi:sorting and assembly machinery component 37